MHQEKIVLLRLTQSQRFLNSEVTLASFTHEQNSLFTGIETTVLRMQWLDQQQPAALPNFESLARHFRFRLLGKACRDTKIRSLLLAHHQDDQVETLLMRMTAGHRMPGLIGIKREANIPECYGIHGVHESGGLDHMARQYSQSTHSSPGSSQATPNIQHRPGTHGIVPIEFGGIRVYRPLLSFNKARLRATCLEEGIQWFEDRTNSDPTITTRNAIRHMYSHHSLPAALSKPALLSMSRRYEKRVAARVIRAETLLAKCMSVILDTRVGVARLCFNDISHFLAASPKNQDSQQIAAIVLRRVIMLVAPVEHVVTSSLHSTLWRIFPELFTNKSQDVPPPKRFTISGTQFSPAVGMTVPTSTECRSKNHEWTLSRQLHPSRPDKQPHSPVRLPLVAMTWSTWTLFDGRFWVRIKTSHAMSLFIRPLLKEDLKNFKANISASNRTKLSILLKELAPGDIRWTLPAIVAFDEAGKETVLCLPTLDIAVQNMVGEFEYEARYKKVSLGALATVLC